jgi:hypothetical protein
MTDDQMGRWIAANCARVDAEEAAIEEAESREQARRWHATVKEKRLAKRKPVRRKAGNCVL